ncbi:MAG TPA: GNAT family N-acyltransferase [Methylomusa anaerophila]|uniref:GNAT family N-acetyltransferase n=1 Tax=Methylomusa anaerophila TaxID=1930071 RepID=A0A348ALC3_9FIRM|nr:GNAT family N-acetyltransferase [Methylomusa anaerophila]BBB91871.1 hypothetical protein MAMMFC1_02556 [Methylomusa anaerophila]HML88398.1 GNAT family N-acyltransferase [Methylomusa anaerophila]
MRIEEGKYLVKLAETSDEKEQVYRLRHDVYHKELNLIGKNAQCEQEYDSYDEICDHLIIRDVEANRCVSTFRFLSGKKLQGNAGFYSEQWFDIGNLSRQRSKVLELGRACIDLQYRNTKVFKMLFAGVGAYLKLYPHDYLIGLTTVSCNSKQHIRMITEYLINKKVVNVSFGIKPKKHFEINEAELRGYTMAAFTEREVFSKMSTLMLAYHKYGAEFISEPSIDVDFNPPVVDFFTIFNTEKYPKWVS